MAVADLNGDGHLDIAACHESLECFVYFNDGKGQFREGIQFDKPAAVAYSMIPTDLNATAGLRSLSDMLTLRA